MSGRRHDNIWLYFHKTKLPGKTGCRAKCKGCGKEIQGLVARMRQHYTDGTATINLTTDFVTIQTHPYLISSVLKRGNVRPYRSTWIHQQRDTNPSCLEWITSLCRHQGMKATIDLQITRFVSATNSSFSIVEHPEF